MISTVYRYKFLAYLLIFSTLVSVLCFYLNYWRHETKREEHAKNYRAKHIKLINDDIDEAAAKLFNIEKKIEMLETRIPKKYPEVEF